MAKCKFGELKLTELNLLYNDRSGILAQIKYLYVPFHHYIYTGLSKLS